jgi:hypothetical protein
MLGALQKSGTGLSKKNHAISWISSTYRYRRTYSTEHAIPRHKLYPFAGKGLSALVGPPDNFRYLPEPVLCPRFRSSKGPLTDRFCNKMPDPDVKTVRLRACPHPLWRLSAAIVP